MSEPADREWRFYIDDMIAFAEKVLSCAAQPFAARGTRPIR